MSGVRTACPYCGVGCGVVATPDGRNGAEIAGDAAHPANGGRLCSKGAALGATLGFSERLLHPMIGGEPVSWDRAIARVAEAFSETIARHGPDSVAFYVSGQLLTEDYYAANKLMKGFIGSANIDTNSRLCMSSAVAAHTGAFGADLVPATYDDVALADLLVVTGHNAAWTHPVLFRRIEAAAQGRGARNAARMVCIDPRRTDTAEASALHLPIRPQSDVRLWNGLAAWLLDHGAADENFVAHHTDGLCELIAALETDDQSLSAIAADCGLAVRDLERFYRWFAATPRTVTLFSQGVNQSAQGVAKGRAIINAHLLTGRIGKPGAAPFSITGQPNAMGGREVGGLATMLAAHMGFTPEEADRVRRFWNAPRIAAAPGLKAVDMFEAVERGQIKALWIMATNPAVSMPDAERVRRALDVCDFVAVSEVSAAADTVRHADVLLPALAWGEKDGAVTNSERVISRQRAFLLPPGQARADWRIVSGVAAAMGWAEHFAWRNAADVFREYAALTAFENDGARVLDLGGLADMTDEDYETLAPVRWPVQRGAAPSGRLFADGRFARPDGRARLGAMRPAAPAAPVSREFPFALITARVRDQWHTMTRTGLAPGLCRHAPEPTLDIHPDDARALWLAPGALAQVETPHGAAVLMVNVTDAMARGVIGAPMHWTDAFAPSGRCNPLTGPHRDPVSGQPEFKHAPARVRPWAEIWRGFAVTRGKRVAWPEGVVWRRIPHPDAQVFEIAGRGGAEEQAAAVAAALDGAEGAEELALDVGGAVMRRARLDNDHVQAVICLGPAGARLPPRDWIAARFAAPLTTADRAALLLGRAPGTQDQGAIVCACMGVGEKRIAAAIADGAGDLDAVGEATGAGTNCGSCRTDIARMLTASQQQIDAAA